jgi:hypothetical protein
MQTILCTPAPDTKKSARKPGRLQAEFRKICDAFLSDASRLLSVLLVFECH